MISFTEVDEVTGKVLRRGTCSDPFIPIIGRAVTYEKFSRDVVELSFSGINVDKTLEDVAVKRLEKRGTKKVLGPRKVLPGVIHNPGDDIVKLKRCDVDDILNRLHSLESKLNP